MADAVLSLGGNLGEPRATLARALDLLCADGTVRLVARSADYRTPPWGDPDQPDFVNLCAVVATTRTPRDLLALARTVETALGRDRGRERRWGPRTVDIDIVSYRDAAGEVVMDAPDLALPHPRAVERAFVLVPLAEIAPDRLIGDTRVRDLAARIDAGGIVRLPSK
ncbi:2-amino-4-hydroxy-6-hydroxymethyldihydropteridine diphosphokinase [Rhodoplanes sp. TEM]|uniref:2-amino-4-hydroxy-6-hydroxymethyldihydropteridine pyrophosphokinase n=1 Tax=Rhodoplanes tepidamans TaxID=200616 RepID=A0ABT5JGU9_RHOTP|nr:MULTISPECIES: 2-amino-4-hydroxy-6-hydroxymethyldihydropteridine diphosphokinase [Rhodoplanes]MDC7788940.1 2-amino-4-hydroxy-6-hydroxymethyldihydropteridine diphosphokinase [Rhodoplanes tepidamans]MDC7987237.1 2-amino-4-hydroxy-6-hydroxymethyldihydropteridine diphosphokinase [Rhodoplanes sp. TEM]MDQ0358634.1 2-amino-4-hydroxy-6-hydroxymethyldihydropteridine diphosphokinase [Rhodoplanes tepidamans]